MHSTLPWWLGNIFVLLAFVVGTGALALFWGRNHKNDARIWRTVETFTTLLGALSLIFLTLNVRTLFAKLYYDTFRENYVGATASLIGHAEFMVRYTCGTVFRKSEASPPNFDDFINDQKIVCEWSQKVLEFIKKLISETCSR